MSDTFEEYLMRGEQAGVIDYHLRIVRTPDGKLDFYIHPQGKDGETGDFTVSAAFVSKLKVGAGSSRSMSAPLVGSGKPQRGKSAAECPECGRTDRHSHSL